MPDADQLDAEDRLVPVDDASEFEWLIADSRKAIYADTGHLPMLERPHRFNTDLQAFLREGRTTRRPSAQGPDGYGL